MIIFLNYEIKLLINKSILFFKVCKSKGLTFFWQDVGLMYCERSYFLLIEVFFFNQIQVFKIYRNKKEPENNFFWLFNLIYSLYSGLYFLKEKVNPEIQSIS
ncbi:hypothetical protein B0A68_22435 [Flavobacterium reichenbachii]|uniref:Uncharacterized protein n=1 Tax=Flavobacterium reichenbachii TaxID=362418 RepID=A0A085ZJY5_9FLAO|nr:hypothetical protein IW19_04020 [Flavobacterium reichenbachii]OXB10352.1 hypothetical protein B0A68_22435 [Flavobacterium reichenbachii]